MYPQLHACKRAGKSLTFHKAHAIQCPQLTGNLSEKETTQAPIRQEILVSGFACFPKQPHCLFSIIFFELLTFHAPLLQAQKTFRSPINSIVANCYLSREMLGENMTGDALLEVMLISVTQNNKPVSCFTPR